MGQHKNSKQVEIFITFMEQNIDLARGFVKGDRVSYDQLWVELAGELNASGPPKKEVSAWRKVWTDWKLCVKQRLGHNKGEATKTGGGRFNKYVLSPYDEQVAIICGLYVSVDGVKSAKSYCGLDKQNVKINADVLPTTTTASRVSPTPMSPSLEIMSVPTTLVTPNGTTGTDKYLNKTPSPGETQLPTPTPTTSAQIGSRKRKRQVADVQDVIEIEAEQFSQMSVNLEKIRRELKENRFYLKEMSRNLKYNNNHIKELKILKEKELNELIRHNYVIEKNLQQKNEMKLQFLQLEQMKLGVHQSTPDFEN